MRHLTRPAAILVVPILLASCGEASPLTASRADRIQARAEAVRSDISVNILDACDAASFNAAVGPGTCSRPGGVTFSQFIAELEKHQVVQAWDFAPPAFQAQVGQTIVATNRGGHPSC